MADNTPPNLSTVLYASVAVVAEQLTDEECLAIFLPLALGSSIQHSIGVEKLETLFTQTTFAGQIETKVMHQETKASLISYLDSRIRQMEEKRK